MRHVEPGEVPPDGGTAVQMEPGRPVFSGNGPDDYVCVACGNVLAVAMPPEYMNRKLRIKCARCKTPQPLRTLEKVSTRRPTSNHPSRERRATNPPRSRIREGIQNVPFERFISIFVKATRCARLTVIVTSQRPKSRVPVEEADAVRLMKLIDGLEESDDVASVHANFDVDAEVLERLAS